MGDKTRGSSGHDPLLGKTFADRYRVERRLGQGGMGVVYAARQLSMDRVVALKVLSAELGASDAARARFVREMRATSKVEHANTVRVYDFGEDGEGHLFLTMELLDGRSLQQELSQRGAFETGRVLRIGESIARALAAAHGEGIVHRDLKPENVMLVDRYGERDGVKVLDFGIARILDGDTSDAVTRTGSLIGTPLYMAPEAALGKKVDHRADLYALGVVLYQMVSGRVPFSDAMPVRVLFMHANDTVPPLAEVAPGRASPPLEALILGLLAKSPDDRPQSATEVASVLRALSDAPTVEGLDADAVSRLAGDEAAMAKARALHADPALAVGTVRDEDAVRTPPVTV
ncbi:MAG: serine/threonine protein kinase, partial [Pseudomonadota bacterium]